MELDSSEDRLARWNRAVERAGELSLRIKECGDDPTHAMELAEAQAEWIRQTALANSLLRSLLQEECDSVGAPDQQLSSGIARAGRPTPAPPRAWPPFHET